MEKERMGKGRKESGAVLHPKLNAGCATASDHLLVSTVRLSFCCCRCAFPVADAVLSRVVAQSLDLVTMNASEDDKIKAMMDQSTKGFDQSKYVCLPTSV